MYIYICGSRYLSPYYKEAHSDICLARDAPSLILRQHRIKHRV
jgi:hypothetical protein